MPTQSTNGGGGLVKATNGQKKKSGKNLHLYTDDNPATTTKGTGFKDRETALRTIRLTEANKPPNKRIWTINTMFYRAKHHPNQTQGMRDAMEIFEAWIKDYKLKKSLAPKSKTKKRGKKGVDTKKPPSKTQKRGSKRKLIGKNGDCDDEEAAKELHEKRVKSQHNGASLANCGGNFGEFHKKTRENMKSGKKSVRTGLQSMGNRIKISCVAFTAVFGAPGIHGYGSHVVDEDGKQHTVTIDNRREMEKIFTKKLTKGRSYARIRFFTEEEQCIVDMRRE